MRKLFAVLLVAAVLVLSADAIAQTPYYSSQDALNKILTGTDSLVVLVTDDIIENVTLVDGAVIPASGKMTVSMPLQPIGNHKTVTFSITTTGTPPDSLYYQIVAAQTMMDSLTVLNIGTIAAPVLTGVIVFPLDASPFHSTGIEIATGVDWSSLSNAKFTGIRLHPDNSRSWTGKVVCNLK